MKKHNQPDTSTPLILRIRIGESSPQLYEALNELGSYYRARRLLQLATLGLAVERTNFSLAEQTPLSSSGGVNEHFARVTSKGAASSKSSSTSKTKTGLENTPTQPHYKIPIDAAEAMGELFAELDK